MIDPIRVRPLHNRVIVRRRVMDADNMDTIVFRGEVIAIGSGNFDLRGQLVPVDMKIGDSVFFCKWAGTELEIDDITYLIMQDLDIMAVLL